MRIALAALVLLIASPVFAEDVKPAKAHELSPAAEAAWIEAVQNFQTDDGTTILQALRYAERLRPSKFKFGKFEAGYNGASGEPEAIAIDFWIGAKREEGDAFSLLFEINRNGGGILVNRPSKTPYGPSGEEAVVLGRDSLLRFIDDMYIQYCVDSNTGAKLC